MNSRPLVPETSALARLRYAPNHTFKIEVANVLHQFYCLELCPHPRLWQAHLEICLKYQLGQIGFGRFNKADPQRASTLAAEVAGKIIFGRPRRPSSKNLGLKPNSNAEQKLFRITHQSSNRIVAVFTQECRENFVRRGQALQWERWQASASSPMAV